MADARMLAEHREGNHEGFRDGRPSKDCETCHPPKVCVEVCTRAYEDSHGKRPTGRGGWAFCFSVDKLDARTADAVNPLIYWTPCGLTYGESRKLAVAEGKRRAVEKGYDLCVVEVMT